MSGGFEPKPKLYELVWGDGPYEGLEITLKGVSTAAFLEMGEMADAMGDPPKPAPTRTLLRRFARLLVEWNITSGGEPVPPVYALCATSGKPPLREDPHRCEDHAQAEDGCEWKGLAALDQELSIEIFQRWSTAVAGVDPTSPSGSASGVTSPGAPPPGLASASRSLRSTPEPA